MGLFGFGKKKEDKSVEVVPESVVAQEPVAKTIAPKAEGEALTIKIFCAGGFSTSLWAKNVEAEMKKQGINGTVSAFSVAMLEEEGANADAILIGPQTRYIASQAEELYPSKPIEVVPFTVFGRADGVAGVEYLKEKGIL
jgi:PTS system cellobiose-specific IIB component